jgi:hypothetical protein
VTVITRPDANVSRIISSSVNRRGRSAVATTGLPSASSAQTWKETPASHRSRTVAVVPSVGS